MSKKLVEGKKAGATPKQPFRARVSATTRQTAKILYGLTVGEARLFGVNPTQKDILTRIYLDGTPIMDASGTKLLDVDVDYRNGTVDQTVIEGVPSVTLPQDVSLEVKYGIPVSRTMVTPNVTQYDIMLNIPQLFSGNEQGESRKGLVSITIDIDNGDGVFKDYGTHTFEEKIINGFTPTITVDVPKAPSHTIRVTKLTPDTTDEYSANAVAIATITEVIAVHMAYPCTALLYLSYDAEQFNNIPKLEVRFFGVSDLLIPANYNFDNNREYATSGAGTTGGVWDGTWKKGYCDNPIWHWLALATNKQWGLGNRINVDMIDKWELYRLAQYCDALVPDGKGGQEPRFTCNNLYLNTAEDAYKVFKDLCSLIRGATIYDGQWLRPRMDTPRDAVHIFSAANVQDLHYSTVEDGAAHNVVHVQYFDKDNRFTQKVVTRRDEEDIRDRGSFFPLEVAAFGVTSEGQAQRAAEYILKSELTETNLISFTTGLEGISPDVGSVFLFADSYTAGKAISGRIKLISDRNIKLDREIGVENVSGTFIANTTQNKVVTRTILAVNGDTVVLDSPLDTSTHPFLVWAVVTKDLAVPEFYVTDASFDQSTNNWSISGVQYSRRKYNEVDQSARVDEPPFTSIIPNGIGAPALVTLSYTNRVVQDVNVYTITAAWSDVANASAYAVEMRRDGEAWVSLGRMATLSYDIDDVYEGVYEVRVRSIDVLGNYSPYAISNPLNMRGKVLPPPVIVNYTVTGVLFGYKHAWTFPAHTGDSRAVRIRYSDTDPVITVNPVINYIDKAYPADTHEDTGIGAGVQRWFSIAIIDKYGVIGEYTMWHTATTSVDPDAIMEIIKGHVGIEAIDDLLKAEIERANGNALEALNVANQTKQDTTAAVNELITDINTERDERLTQAAQLQDGITNAQTTADGVVTDLTNYKASTNTTLANYQESINILNNANSSNVSRLNALDVRMEGAETNVATALQKSQAAVDATTALSETVQANTAAIGNKADSSYVEQVKVTADNANNVANANATAIVGINSRVGAAESSINTINQTKANKDEVASIAQQALQSTWQQDAQNKVDAVQVGGRNLVRNSNVGGQGRTGYPFFSELVTQTFLDGEDMVITVWGALESGTRMAIYNSGGNVQLGWVDHVEGRKYQGKFKWVVGGSMNQWIDIYAINHQGGGVTVVDKVKLERGTKGTDWTAAPEDMLIGGRNLVRKTGYPQTTTGAGWIFQEALTVKPLTGKVTISFEVTAASSVDGGGIGFNMGDSGGGGLDFFWYPEFYVGRQVKTIDVNSQNLTHFGIYVNVATTIKNIKVEQGTEATAWSPAPEDTVVGGRNLLYNSDFEKGLRYWSTYAADITVVTDTIEGKQVKYVYMRNGAGGLYMKPENIPYIAKAGDVMTLSFTARGANASQMIVGFDDSYTTISLTNAWKRYSVTLQRKYSNNVIMYMNGANYIDLALPKLELGSVATDWTPAPEDIQEDLRDYQATVTNTYSTKADTTSAVASGIQEFNATTGNLKVYTASSAGWGIDGSAPIGDAGIRNGKGAFLARTSRNYGVTIFNVNGDWARQYNYDTFSAGAADEVANRIWEASNDEIIVITSYDEPQSGRNANMRNAFISIGGTGTAFDNLAYRGAYLLVGRKGLLEGGGVEMLTSGARIDYPLQFVNGVPTGLAGNAAGKIQNTATANALQQTTATVSEHEGRIQSLVTQTNTLTSTVSQAQQTADLALINKTVEINLTGFAQNIWLPVGIRTLPTDTRSNFVVSATLNNKSHPTWATHQSGFSLSISWTSTGAGWGTIDPNRVVSGFAYSWVANGASPVIRIDQLSPSSTEVIWLRGGAIYDASIPKACVIQLPDNNGRLTDVNEGNTYVESLYYTDQWMPKTVQAKTETNTVTLQQQAQVIDGISANWTVKINNNGYTTGFGLVSTPYGQGVLGAAMFDVDAFVVGKAGTNIRPFVVVAGGQTVDGTYYPNAGAYFNASYHSFASIKTAYMQDASITNAKIADAAITNAKIDNLAVTNAKIRDLSVSTLKVQDRAITAPYFYIDTNPVRINRTKFGSFPKENGIRIIPTISKFYVSGLTPYAEVMFLVDMRIIAIIDGFDQVTSLIDTSQSIVARLLAGSYNNGGQGGSETANAQQIGSFQKDTTYILSGGETGTSQVRYTGTEMTVNGTIFRKLTADANGVVAASIWISSLGSVSDGAYLSVKPISSVSWYVLELKK